MSTTAKYLRGTNTAIFTTELNTMANNALVLSPAITFSETQYLLGEITLVATYGVAPTVNTGCSVWFLRETDGTNYEDGSTSVTPARTPDVVIPLNAVTTIQRIILQAVLPPGAPKILIKNDGTGQSMAASANTLNIRPLTFQDV